MVNEQKINRWTTSSNFRCCKTHESWILNIRSSVTIKNRTCVHTFLTGNDLRNKTLKYWRKVTRHSTYFEVHSSEGPEDIIDKTVTFGRSSVWWKLAHRTENNCLWPATSRHSLARETFTDRHETMRLTQVMRFYLTFKLLCQMFVFPQAESRSVTHVFAYRKTLNHPRVMVRSASVGL